MNDKSIDNFIEIEAKLQKVTTYLKQSLYIMILANLSEDNDEHELIHMIFSAIQKNNETINGINQVINHK